MTELFLCFMNQIENVSLIILIWNLLVWAQTKSARSSSIWKLIGFFRHEQSEQIKSFFSEK